MAASNSDVVRLSRPLGARLVGGSRSHAVLAVLFLLDLVATVVAALAGAGSSAFVLPLSTAVLFLLSAFGFAAMLSVEASGIAWRAVTRHAFPWTDVKTVRFTSAPRSVLGNGTRPAVVVTLDRFDYTLTPALGVPAARLLPFAQRMAAFARAAGVDVEVDDERWGELRAGS